jgi:flagellar biosynthetic protein FlhB
MTQEPTAQRLRRAFREGDVPLSSMAVRTAALFAAVAALPSAARAIHARFVDRLRAALEPGAVPDLGATLADVAMLAGPILAVGAVVAVVIGLLQTRGATTLGAAARGRGHRQERRMSFFDGQRALRAALGVGVVVTVAIATLGTLRGFAPDIARAIPGAQRSVELMGTLLRNIALPLAALLAAAAAADLWLEHRAWLARLRMSPQEVKDERREQEGDPLMRRARRRAHEEIVRGSPRPPH